MVATTVLSSVFILTVATALPNDGERLAEAADAARVVEGLLRQQHVNNTEPSGEEYCQTGSRLRNKELCEDSGCCHWNTQEAGEASFDGAGRCWSSIGNGPCLTGNKFCPANTFDVERTCADLGEWCDDPAAVDGCLDCLHCDAYDRRQGKCPECQPAVQARPSGVETKSGEEYCETGGRLRNKELCEDSDCCHWNTWEDGEASFDGAGRCWSSIGKSTCLTGTKFCPADTFDVERTCADLGEWCDDHAAVHGCLACHHCDASDRRQGKCPECQPAASCPVNTFDVERTCTDLGEWCDDPAAVHGCLECHHCDASDRQQGKCPECSLAVDVCGCPAGEGWCSKSDYDFREGRCSAYCVTSGPEECREYVAGQSGIVEDYGEDHECEKPTMLAETLLYTTECEDIVWMIENDYNPIFDCDMSKEHKMLLSRNAFVCKQLFPSHREWLNRFKECDADTDGMCFLEEFEHELFTVPCDQEQVEVIQGLLKDVSTCTEFYDVTDLQIHKMPNCDEGIYNTEDGWECASDEDVAWFKKSLEEMSQHRDGLEEIFESGLASDNRTIIAPEDLSNSEVDYLPCEERHYAMWLAIFDANVSGCEDWKENRSDLLKAQPYCKYELEDHNNEFWANPEECTEEEFQKEKKDALKKLQDKIDDLKSPAYRGGVSGALLSAFVAGVAMALATW